MRLCKMDKRVKKSNRKEAADQWNRIMCTTGGIAPHPGSHPYTLYPSCQVFNFPGFAKPANLLIALTVQML